MYNTEWEEVLPGLEAATAECSAQQKEGGRMMVLCPYCERDISVSPEGNSARTKPYGTPVVIVSCPYCHKLLGMVPDMELIEKDRERRQASKN